ncbi:MAG TPA: competence/damage-inducible protein A [Geminicoccaceae bacterium]|nr:competence/damage-inducible protein A [Geminicoccaceae bacterium]
MSTSSPTAADERPVTAALIVIGNEILSGRTVDANLPFIAGELGGIGVRLSEVRVVRDEEAAIVEAVNALRARYSYVFTTGGIGPTHDDITALSVARAFGRRLVRNPEAERRLRAYYKDREIEVNEARLRMANAPEGAELIDNPVSAAPGFRVENVYVFAGVPRIMQAMFQMVKPGLTGGPPQLARAIVVFRPEGEVAAGLGEIQVRFPEVEIGSYPFMRRERFGTTIVFRGTDRARIDAAAAALLELARSLGAETEEDAGVTAGP